MPGSAESNRQEYAVTCLLGLSFSDDSSLKNLGSGSGTAAVTGRCAGGVRGEELCLARRRRIVRNMRSPACSGCLFLMILL